MTEIITTQGLGYQYGKAWAIREASFSVQTGEVFGLVGPDGAGKSTLIRMLTGIQEPTAGEARVLGHNLRQRDGAFQVRTTVGHLSQGLSLYHDLTVLENLRFCARLTGVREAQAQIDLLLATTGLQNHRSKLASALSGGMRQKLALACSLIHSPPLVFLDEPSTGVDPVSRREFWELITRFQQQGVTFVVSTHYMDEAERCGRVALMLDGRILAVDTPERFRQQFDRPTYEVVFSEGRQAIAAARLMAGSFRVRVVGDRLRIFGAPGQTDPTPISRALASIPGGDGPLRLVRPTLEDVFVSFIVAS